jgi:hypothetical protein
MFACALVVGTPLLTLGSLTTAQAQQQRSAIMPVKDLKPGMKGYGLTVFKGTKPDKFDVEIVGVLHQFRPNQDLILIKTPHERLNIAHTVAGMSGSPIFINNKIIGAYAYGWQFGSEPFAGVTPIENMLSDMRRPVPPELLKPIPVLPKTGKKLAKASKVWKKLGLQRHAYHGKIQDYDLKKHAKTVGTRLAGNFRSSTSTGSVLLTAKTPVSLGGLGTRSAAMLTELLGPAGLEPMQGGGTGTGKKAAAKGSGSARFVDGGAIGVQLIRGDMSAMGLGTVTRVEGDKLVAFGHPMMQGGISHLPTAIAQVHWILASQMRSFKIGEPWQPLGTMINDQQASIVVDQTVKAPTFPITVKVEGVKGAPKTEWKMEVAHDQFLSPTFMAVAMGNTVESTVSEKRDATWEVHTKIKITGHGTIETRDFGIAIGGTPSVGDFFRSRATTAVGRILNNPWESAGIESVEMTMKIDFARNLLTIRGVKVLDEVVDAGQDARVELRLRKFNGQDELRIIKIPIPKALAGKTVGVLLVPGWMEHPDVPAPENLSQLISNLPKETFAPDVLMAVYQLPEHSVMFNGQRAELLPPSAFDMLRPQSDSRAPQAAPTTVRIPFSMGKFIDGRDSVIIRVREVLR